MLGNLAMQHADYEDKKSSEWRIASKI
jgi:hypothetical protein